MSKLQIVDAKTMEGLLFLLGFERVCQKGSHVFYRHPDGRTTTIPHHKNFRWQAIDMFIKNKSLILKLLTKISEKPE